MRPVLLNSQLGLRVAAKEIVKNLRHQPVPLFIWVHSVITNHVFIILCRQKSSAYINQFTLIADCKLRNRIGIIFLPTVNRERVSQPMKNVPRVLPSADRFEKRR